MNEIEAKINSKNPVLIGQVIGRLIEAIRKNYKNDLKQVPEYKYLTEKCVVQRRSISIVASRAVVELVETNVLPLKAVLDDIISNIFGNGYMYITNQYNYTIIFDFYFRNLIGVIYILYNLLIIAKRRQLSSFEVTISGHPLVQVIERSNSNATIVIDQIKTGTIVHYELFRPIYFYIFNEPNVAETTRQRLWLYILENENCEHIHDLLKWMQVKKDSNAFRF